MWTKEFIVSPYETGDGENTVKFISEIQARHPQKKLLLIWDGATYHRGEVMKKFLAQENQGKQALLLVDNLLFICTLYS